MTFADGCKESMYLTWKSERYKVTPAFESLSFYDNRDGNVSCYCISLTRDWYEKKNYPRWDDYVAIDGDLSEEVVEQWISCYESQSGGLQYGDGRFEHFGWNSFSISVLDKLIHKIDTFTVAMLENPERIFNDRCYHYGLHYMVQQVAFDIYWCYRKPKGLKELNLTDEECILFFIENVHVFADYFERFSAQLKDMKRLNPGTTYFVMIGP